MRLLDIFEGDVIDFNKHRNKSKISVANQGHNEFKPELAMLKRMVSPPKHTDSLPLQSRPMVPAKSCYTDKDFLPIIQQHWPGYYEALQEVLGQYGFVFADDPHPQKGWSCYIQQDSYSNNRPRLNFNIPWVPDTEVTHGTMVKQSVNVMRKIFGSFATSVEVGGGLGSRLFVYLSDDFLNQVNNVV